MNKAEDEKEDTTVLTGLIPVNYFRTASLSSNLKLLQLIKRNINAP
jgi:hypothetical protein